MKTLKKVLSLVLVVAMIASMLIVGAAAAEETNYPEAASVITGIKVMEGDERGMRYGDTVTRAEAAAIICRLLLGETAETLKTATAPFADVAATHWAAPYVTYLKGLGVVSGVGGNNYAPNANVTGLQFAKMLLVALGYNAVGEYESETSDAWDINILTDAFGNGIYDNTKALDIDAPATREECMLYAFNALTVPTVKYNKTFESYYTGKSVIDPADTAAELMEYTLASQKFNLETVPTTDAFGRPAANYSLGNDVLALGVPTAEADFELSNVIYGADLYAKLGAAAAKVDKIITRIDGAAPTTETNAANIASLLSPYHAAIYASTPITLQGAHLEAYVSEEWDAVNEETDTILTLVVWYEHIGTIASINPQTGVSTLSVADSISGMIADATVGAEVIYTMSPAAAVAPYFLKVTSAEVAEPFVATFQKIDAFGQYVFDGVAYPASSQIDTRPAAYGSSYKVWVDSLGNLLDAELVTYKVTDYLYLKDDYIVKATGGIGAGVTEQKTQLEVIYATGKYAIVDVATTLIGTDLCVYVPGNTPSPWVAIENADAALTEGAWYAYVTNADGTVTLVEKLTSITSLDVTPGVYKLNNDATYGKATSKTVLNVVNELGARDTYVGIANFPDSSVKYTNYASYVVMVELDLAGNITVINAYAGADSLAAVTSNIGYVAQYLYQDLYGYHYSVSVNGATVEAIGAANLTGGVYEITLKDGVYSINTLTNLQTYDSAYNTTYRMIFDNVITVVDEQYFTIKADAYDVDPTDDVTYYYNAVGTPTYIYDTVTGGAGTLTVGRNATIVYSGEYATYIFLH